MLSATIYRNQIPCWGVYYKTTARFINVLVKKKSSREDFEIVQRVQSGDIASYELLIIKYESAIKGLVSQYLPVSDDVDDVTQEVFFSAYLSIGTFRFDSQFFSWLYRIAINASLARLRKRAKTIALDYDVNDESIVRHVEILWDISTPETHHQLNDLIDIIRTSISSMPCEYRSVLLMCVDGMSYKAISENLKIPLGTVRSRLNRGREYLSNDIQVKFA